MIILVFQFAFRLVHTLWSVLRSPIPQHAKPVADMVFWGATAALLVLLLR
jgi:hypothetical protein